MAIKKKEHYFYTCDGKSLKDIDEMLDWIQNSHQDHFSHHINKEKNDFSNWTKEILKDTTLAKKLKSNMNREELIKIIEERLEEKNKKKSNKKKIISKIKGAYNGS